MPKFERHSSKGRTTGLPALQYCRHALVRMQQRGIRKDLAELIVEYGNETPEGSGRSRFTIFREQSLNLQAEGIPIAHLERALGTWVIVASGTMITGYRGNSRRICRSAKNRGKRAARRRQVADPASCPSRG
jgi:hypothetical protein